jgi:hypothetical protein
MEPPRHDKRRRTRDQPAATKHPRADDSRSARKRIAIDAQHSDAASHDYMPIRSLAAIDIVERVGYTLGVDRDTTRDLVRVMKQGKRINCIDDLSTLACLLLGETLCDGARVSAAAAVLATVYAHRHNAIHDDRLIAHMAPDDMSGMLFAVSTAYATEKLAHTDVHEHTLIKAIQIQQTEPRADILMRFLGTCQPSCGGAIVAALASLPCASDNTRIIVHAYVNGVY